MTTINKVLIGALVVQLGLAAVTLSRDESIRLGKLEPVIANFDNAAVERIEIFNAPPAADGAKDADAAKDAAGKPALELAKKDGSWVVRSHFDYPAEAGKVTELLDKVAGLQSRGPVARTAARHSQLSVAEDDFARKVVVHRQGAEPLVLYVGDPAGGRTTAVRLGGSTDIHAISGFSSSSLPTAVTGWVDATLVDMDATQVGSIQLRNAAGEFAFERKAEGGWQLAATAAAPADAANPAAPAANSPAGKPLDSAAIDALVRAAATVRMVEPADPARKAAPPLATVTVRMKPPAPPADGSAPAMSVVAEEHTLEIGPEEGTSYLVRLAGSSTAVAVAKTSLEPLVSFTGDTMYAGAAAAAPAPAAN